MAVPTAQPAPPPTAVAATGTTSKGNLERKLEAAREAKIGAKSLAAARDAAISALWVKAKDESGLDKPMKMDVKALADGLAPGEMPDRVLTLRWSFASAGAIGFTPDSVVLAQEPVSRTMRALIETAPLEWRSSSRCVRVPRTSINTVEFGSESVKLVTDRGELLLMTPKKHRSGAMDSELSKLRTLGANAGQASVPPSPVARPASTPAALQERPSKPTRSSDTPVQGLPPLELPPQELG
jgi:hypothetical protein